MSNQSMIAPTETLVKYENPVLVSKNTDKKKVRNAHELHIYIIIYIYNCRQSYLKQTNQETLQLLVVVDQFQGLLRPRYRRLMSKKTSRLRRY